PSGRPPRSISTPRSVHSTFRRRISAIRMLSHAARRSASKPTRRTARPGPAVLQPPSTAATRSGTSLRTTQSPASRTSSDAGSGGAGSGRGWGVWVAAMAFNIREERPWVAAAAMAPGLFPRVISLGYFPGLFLGQRDQLAAVAGGQPLQQAPDHRIVGALL